MQYHIFLLKFLTPVHFGNTANGGALDKVAINCSADTLFAALCNEAAAQKAELVGALMQKLESGELLLSSLLPYWRTEEEFQFYLPKPLMKPVDEQRQLPQSYNEVKSLRSQIKKQKKSTYVRASQMQALLSGSRELEAHEFAVPLVAGRVGLRDELPRPYYVGSCVFSPQAGLYLVCGVQDEADIDLLRDLLVSLGYSGIGGKRSSGYGKFEVLVDEEIDLYEDGALYDDDSAMALMLHDTQSKLQMCIAPLCPKQQDVEAVKCGCYKLIKRGGFIDSPAASTNVKRDSVYMLQEGTCLERRLQGRLLQQSVDGLPHKVYRAGVGMFVGLKDE